MSEAIVIVHWPGHDVLACAEHALKLKALAAHMGFPVSIGLLDLSPDRELVCSNCENEKQKDGAA